MIVFQVDVVGTLQFWGVTIEISSSILIILCVGLAVDYSAHVGHTFMTMAGNKQGEYLNPLPDHLGFLPFPEQQILDCSKMK